MTKEMKLAFDRSLRSIDKAGRMHVERSHISKVAVNGYIGREIPKFQELGLDPDRIYMLLRDPEELAKGAATFNNIQLLYRHVPVTVDDHQPDLVVGSTGTDAVFDGKYLDNSLVIWEAIAIAGIDSRDQYELSSAYWYDADMTPGVYDGVPYDGVMRNIQGNHVALVEVGRAGPDVVVGDANPFIQPMEYSNMKASRKAIAVRAALGVYLRPQLAMDAAIVDLGALVRGVKAATIAQDKARIVKAVKEKIPGIDIDVLGDVIQMAADAEPDDDKEGKKEKPAEDEDDDDKQREDESDEDYAKRKKAKASTAADEEDPPAKKDDKKDDKADKAAMDEAIKVAMSVSEKATIKRLNDIRQAEKDVQPFIGEVVAQDSAAAVYKLALDHAGVDVADVPPAAYGALVRMLPKPGSTPEPTIAQDAASTSSFNARFPTAGKLKRS